MTGDASSSPARGGADSLLPLALILTVGLTAWWAGLAWRDLGALRLPEPDDMVRLAQIRDWLDGQAFADLVQQRLGPPGGTALHWSRLPDLVPAFLISLFAPVTGITRAEVAAVIFWPEILLFAHLLLAGALARKLGPPASGYAALAIAALAFPAIELFVPGRIDHHALQIVLVEAMLLALLARRMLAAGLAAGVSLLVGVETAPVIAAAMLWLGVEWTGGHRKVRGFGPGVLIAAVAGYVLLRPEPWPSGLCDGFTPAVLAGMVIGGAGWTALDLLDRRLVGPAWRVGTIAAIGALSLAALWLAAPACFASPYGPADPELGRLWPGQPGEFGGLPAQPLGRAVAWASLPLVALVYAGLLARRSRTALLLALVIAVSVAGAFVQLRSLWFAAAFAAPVLAQLVTGASRRGAAWQVGAWGISAGLVWQAVGELVLDPTSQTAVAVCTDRETLSALDRLDTGAFAAPLDLSAYIVGASQHRSLAGPYHRNNRGTRAMADLFRATPEEARYQASLWSVDYVALCPADDGGLPPGLLRPDSLAAHLLAGAPPAWLDPTPLIGSELLVWRVRPVAAPGLRP